MALRRSGAGTFKGGEGVLLLLHLRASGASDWPRTLFAAEGRSISWGLLVAYSFIMFAIVAPLCVLVDWSKPPSMLVSLSDLSTPLGFAGTCLFFLLVFRNNNSYNKWWEGRGRYAFCWAF